MDGITHPLAVVNPTVMIRRPSLRLWFLRLQSPLILARILGTPQSVEKQNLSLSQEPPKSVFAHRRSGLHKRRRQLSRSVAVTSGDTLGDAWSALLQMARIFRSPGIHEVQPDGHVQGKLLHFWASYTVCCARGLGDLAGSLGFTSLVTLETDDLFQLAIQWTSSYQIYVQVVDSRRYSNSHTATLVQRLPYRLSQSTESHF